MKVRLATADDIPVMMKLAASAPHAGQWTQEQHSEFLQEESSRLALVAEDDNDEIIGFLVSNDILGEWELENIVVSETARRRSVATHLLQEMIRYCAKHSGMCIHLEVRESNTAAIMFYRKSGFEVFRRRTGYYNSPKEDAIEFHFKMPGRSDGIPEAD